MGVRWATQVGDGDQGRQLLGGEAIGSRQPVGDRHRGRGRRRRGGWGNGNVDNFQKNRVLCTEIGSFCSVLALTQPRDPGRELCHVAMSKNTLAEYGVRWFLFLWLSCGLGLMYRVETVAQRRLARHYVGWLVLVFWSFCSRFAVSPCARTPYLVGSYLFYSMARMKMEARAAGDAHRGKRRRQRQDGDGPGQVIEASVTVSVEAAMDSQSVVAYAVDRAPENVQNPLCWHGHASADTMVQVLENFGVLL
ncbi:hypothetical protein L7F22_049668 [Adiantum nelumboides]|nr:hypothetical protein [Adiantum nelumboides]